MAQAPTETKKTRKSFTRTEKPVYLVVRYKDENDQPVKLDKARLTVTIERDADKVMEIQEQEMGTATISRVTLPKATKPKAEAPAA